MTIQKGDFIKLDYTGTIKEDGIVFDTTDENKAKEAHIHSPKANYGPIILCVGERQVVAGLDDELIGKDVKKTYEITVPVEKAFGKKRADYIQLVPTAKFKSQNIRPMPGLQVNIDGVMGTIKTVTGGRTLVDFNHPLSGKDLDYNITIHELIVDTQTKAHEFLKLLLGNDVQAVLKETKLTVKTKMDLPEAAQKQLTDKLTTLIKEIKEISFEKL